MPTFDREKEIVFLARSFPSLKDAPLEPWNYHAFDKWAAKEEAVLARNSRRESLMLAYAAQFVLQVWAGSRLAEFETFRVGEFIVTRAMHVWDEEHRNAFRAWAAAPWSR